MGEPDRASVAIKLGMATNFVFRTPYSGGQSWRKKPWQGRQEKERGQHARFLDREFLVSVGPVRSLQFYAGAMWAGNISCWAVPWLVRQRSKGVDGIYCGGNRREAGQGTQIRFLPRDVK